MMVVVKKLLKIGPCLNSLSTNNGEHIYSPYKVSETLLNAL